jgi:hypothetical protein
VTNRLCSRCTIRKRRPSAVHAPHLVPRSFVAAECGTAAKHRGTGIRVFHAVGSQKRRSSIPRSSSDKAIVDAFKLRERKRSLRIRQSLHPDILSQEIVDNGEAALEYFGEIGTSPAVLLLVCSSSHWLQLLCEIVQRPVRSDFPG